MKLEYLCKNENYKDIIDSLDFNEKITFKEDKTNELCILSFEMASESKDSAKILSDTKAKISECSIGNDMFLLVDESSEYFNKELYPLYNKFERLLRKVLYLVSTRENNSSAFDIAKQLETFDFGKIYENVFISKNFNDSIKRYINNKLRSKNELIEEIRKLEEDTIWNALFKDCNNFISNHFLEIREHRNDIMHAHNISYLSYTNALKIIKKANNILEEVIKKCLSNELDVSIDTTMLLTNEDNENEFALKDFETITNNSDTVEIESTNKTDNNSSVGNADINK